VGPQLDGRLAGAVVHPSPSRRSASASAPRSRCGPVHASTTRSCRRTR
jgi:hypothetical protein